MLRHNTKAVVKDLGLFEKDLYRGIEITFRRSLEKIVADSVAYIDKRDLISEGDLRSSITSDVRRRIDKLIGEVGSNQAHAVFVHEGTAPHWPPVQAMRDWVARQVARGRIDTDDIKSTAFLISRTISKRGTKANPFLEVSLRANQGAMVRAIEARIRKT